MENFGLLFCRIPKFRDLSKISFNIAFSCDWVLEVVFILYYKPSLLANLEKIYDRSFCFLDKINLIVEPSHNGMLL